MKLKLTLAALAAVGLVVFVGFGMDWFGPHPSDEEMVKQGLEESIRASREGRAGSVLDYLCREFEVNGERFGAAEIASRVRKAKPNIKVTNLNPQVLANTASMDSPVNLSLSVPAVSVDLSSVHFEFAREDDRKWGIFPAKRWKLQRVQVPDQVYQEVSQNWQ